MGAHQIINWYASIIYFKYLVRAKSFGAHKLIRSSWTRKTCDTVTRRGGGGNKEYLQLSKG